MKKHHGFTLIDLMITIAIMGILIGIAIPNLSQMIAEKSSDAYAYTIWRALAKTREEAISSGQRTTLCGVDENNRCVRDDIRALIIFQDTNQDHQQSEGEPVLQLIDLNYSGSINLRASNQKYITFASSGYALQFGSIVLCHASKSAQTVRRISVNPSGRSYVAKIKAGDETLKSATGTEINCS